MTAKFTVDGTNTTIIFSWSAPTAKVQAIVGSCAEYIWERGYGDHGTPEDPIAFESLTNQQKLNLVDAYIKEVILNTANTFKSIKAQDAARFAEEEAKYSLV